MKFSKPLYVPERQVQHAKSMRSTMTEPERKLWKALRQRLPLKGTHFRRQVPIGPYIVDFVCLAQKMVIELDGNQHGTDEALMYDARRTMALEAQGYRVLRFTNHDVNRAIDTVLDTILSQLEQTQEAIHG